MPGASMLAVIAIVACALVAYAHSFTNAFVTWDDTYLIYFNPAIKSISFQTLHRIFTTYDPELYIPFTLFTYQIDYLVGGLNPTLFHFHSFVLHAASAVLLFFIFKKVSNERIGFLVALLFAIHPLNVEAVAWASGRKDVLAIFWCFASIALWLRSRERQSLKFCVLSLSAFLLALLAKVVVLTLPLLLLLLDFREHRRWSRALFAEKIPYFALSVLFGIIALIGKESLTSASTFTEKFLMAAKSSMFYLEKIFFPTSLAPLYPYTHEIEFSSPDFFVPLLLCTALIIAAFIALRRSREAAFGISFFFVSLLPTFTSFVKGRELEYYIGSDRYPYLASVGIFFLVALAFDMLFRRAGSAGRHALSGITAVVILLLLFLTRQQASVWKNSESLYLHALAVSPEAADARINLAQLYRESGRTEDARRELKQISDGTRVKVNIGLAAIEEKEGNLEGAEKYLRSAAHIDPTNPDPLLGLGALLARRGQGEEAEKFYRHAINLDPARSSAHVNFGVLLTEQKRFAEAQAEFELAESLDPLFPDLLYNWAYLKVQEGKKAEAIDLYKRAITADPDSVDTYVRIAPLLIDVGQNEEGIDALQHAIRLKLDDSSVQQAALDGIKAILQKDSSNSAAKKFLDELIFRGILQRN